MVEDSAKPADAWNPALYNRFQQARSQPGIDLTALVEPRPAMVVVDLGCGDGQLTAYLHQKLQAASTLGLDSSANMLEKAPADPSNGLTFQQGQIEQFDAVAGYDLVFSNAALHWAGDHRRLIPRLIAALRPGGQLAVQLPAMFEHASHLLAADVARQAPYFQALGGYVYQSPVLPLEEYAQMLFDCGAHRQIVRAQIYGQVLADRHGVADWLSGTLLTTYASRLSPAMYQQYLAEFRRGIERILPDRQPYFYGYRRWLLWAEF